MLIKAFVIRLKLILDDEAYESIRYTFAVKFQLYHNADIKHLSGDTLCIGLNALKMTQFLGYPY